MAKNNDISIRSSAAEYLTYIASTGADDESIEMRYEDENIWLTQKMMAALYGGEVRLLYHDGLQVIKRPFGREKHKSSRAIGLHRTGGIKMQVMTESDVVVKRDVVERKFFDFTEWRRTNLPDDDVELLSQKATEYAQTLG